MTRLALLILSFFMTLALQSFAWAAPIEIVLGGLKVMESKPNGAPWDAGFGSMTHPDLIIEVSIDDKVLFTTPKAANTHSAAQVISSPIFDLKMPVSLSIRVIDKDLRADDIIDIFTLSITSQQIKSHDIFQLAGKSVTSLSLQLKPTSLKRIGPPRLNVFSPSLKSIQTVQDHQK